MISKAKAVISIITLFFLLLTIGQSIRITQKYGGGDLRIRVVGTRILGTQHSPYFYKWNPGDGEYYLDPFDDIKRIVNGNVVTPACMMIMYPIALLPYNWIWPLWTVLQVFAGLLIIYLLFKRNSLVETIHNSFIPLVGFICSEVFLYNIERGQVYIFYTLVFAIMYRCYKSEWKYNEFGSGFIGGIFILLRPFSAILGLAFLLKWKKKWLLGCICGFIFACILFVLPRPKVWQDYFIAMQVYVEETQGQARENLNAQAFKKPDLIENTPNLEKQKIFTVDRLDTAYNNFKRFGINISNSTSAILYVIILMILSVLFFRNRFANNAESLFLFGFLAYILAEFFVIAPRGAYNVIQWLFPISIIYLIVRRDIVVVTILITSLLLFHQFPFFFPGQAQLTEIIFISLTAFTMLVLKRFRPILKD